MQTAIKLRLYYHQEIRGVGMGLLLLLITAQPKHDGRIQI